MKFKYPNEERRKPPVPKRDEQPILGLKTNKNFITQNAIENIMAVPKKPEKNYADTRKGDKHPLEPSGLEPKFVHKKVTSERALCPFVLSELSGTSVV